MCGTINCTNCLFFAHEEETNETSEIREVFGVSSGQRTDDKEICWLNKEVQATLQRKSPVRTKVDGERMAEI